MRLNIRKLKSLLWLLSVLAFAGAGYSFWDIVRGKKVEGRYTPNGPEHYQNLLWQEVDDKPLEVAKQGRYAEAKYRTTWTARVDGSVEPVPVAPGTETEELVQRPKAPPIHDVVDVGMVLWNTDPLRRVVAITYKDGQAPGAEVPGKLSRLHLAEGEPLQSPYDAEPYLGKVLEIGRQSVRFAWGEGEVTLTPSLGREGRDVTVDAFQVAAADDPSRAYAGSPEESVEVAPGHWVVGQRDLESLRTGGKEILDTDVTLRSVTPTEGRSFLELMQVRPDSLPGRYGFQAGDRLISVNGIPMPSVSAGLNWAQNNPNLPAYHILFERAGKAQTKIIYVKDND